MENVADYLLSNAIRLTWQHRRTTLKTWWWELGGDIWLQMMTFLNKTTQKEIT